MRPSIRKQTVSVTPLQALDQPALFRFEDPQTGANLSERERRLLVGALNFHALMAPQRTLRIHLYDGSVETTPRLTDDSTFDGLSRNNRHRIESFDIVSSVSVEEREPELTEAASARLVASPARHLHVSSDGVLDSDPVSYTHLTLPTNREV